MKLYTNKANYQASKIIIAAKYNGVEIEVIDTKLAATKKMKTPVATLPLLETGNGFLFESNAILRLMGKSGSAKADGLYGDNAEAAALIDSWVDYSANVLEVPAQCWVGQAVGWMKPTAGVAAQASKDIKAALSTLEKHLANETFFVGRAVTIADIAIACALVLPMKFMLDKKARKSCPSVVRWFDTVCNQAEFKAVLGPVTLCEKALAVNAPAAAAPVAKPTKAAAAAPKPAAAAPKKKAKNPLELLPKSSLIADAWKRQYSNAPGGDCYKAMPWFWENYDKEGWSLHFGTYNYNEENTSDFMTSNLVTGFVQRCDEVRKYSFGVIQIIGEGPFDIVMCWLIRGDSIKPLIDCNPDAEYYTWKKVEALDDATKKRVEEMWCACETVAGKPVMDCKVFK